MIKLPLDVHIDQVAFLGDTHAGVRDGNKIMMKHQLDYLENEFIPFLLANNIKLVIQTGDIFDVRKYTNTEVLREWKVRFFDTLAHHDIHMLIYIGNHDMFYKNRISPNSIRENLGNYDNLTIVEEISEVMIGGKTFLIVPWICSENEEEIMYHLRNSFADVVCGHFEIKGAAMESGTCTDGLPLSLFNRFRVVISGHFHTPGLYENVQYVGSPYQLTWGCYGGDRGFWTMDTANCELEYHKNERDLFHKITYNEDRDMSVHKDFDYQDLYVKVVIEHREDYKAFESWLIHLENSGAASLTVLEPFLDRDEGDSELVVEGDLEVLSTPDIIKEYVADVYPEKQKGLTDMMLGLYNNAQRVFGSD